MPNVCGAATLAVWHAMRAALGEQCPVCIGGANEAHWRPTPASWPRALKGLMYIVVLKVSAIHQ